MYYPEETASINCFTETDKYVSPVKKIKAPSNITEFQKSEAFYDVHAFINGICIVIQGKKLSDDCHVSETMKNILEIFDNLDKLIDETPPIEQPYRTINLAYRMWYKKMSVMAPNYLVDAIPRKYQATVTELSAYFLESFGNPNNITYGTEHELNFIMLLCCFYKIGVFEEKDKEAVILKLFNTYLILVRRLQKTYRMEPADTQGVWSLDDFQFVAFIWGSAQLSLDAPFPPNKILDEEVISTYKNDYMYIACIDYICQGKVGHLAEHSCQLWSVSSMPDWHKINSGLRKMYSKEILSQFPTVQHLMFGTIMSFDQVQPGTMLYVARLGVPVENYDRLPPILKNKSVEENN